MKYFSAILIALCFYLPGYGQNDSLTREYTLADVPNVQLQNAAQFVSDPGNLLKSATKDSINAILFNLRRNTTVEVAVVVLPSTGQIVCDEFALQLLNTWGVGKTNDNGLVVLFVNDQHCIKFETGYGLEGVLPDAICKRIQTEKMLPFFREENYDQGMLEGIRAVSERISSRDSAELADLYGVSAEKKSKETNPGSIILWDLLIGLLFFLAALSHMTGKNRSLRGLSKDTRWASLRKIASGWMIASLIFPLGSLLIYFFYRKRSRQIRFNPMNCSQCGQTMRRLGENEEDSFLSAAAISEENVGSVDHDVWVCPDCKKVERYSYKSALTLYSECPSCHARTYHKEGEQIVQRATQISSGLGERVFSCANCRHTDRIRFVIPPIPLPPASRGGGFGGGFGGGGFGGGGFGGGSSGGGGASSHW